MREGRGGEGGEEGREENWERREREGKNDLTHPLSQIPGYATGIMPDLLGSYETLSTNFVGHAPRI